MRSSLLLAALVVSAVLLLAPWLMRRKRIGPLPRSGGGVIASAESGDAGGGTIELRRQVLTREMLRRSPSGDPSAVRCVLMDWNIGGDRVATLVAYDDGTTSLYLSSGGGVIGAGAHAAVRAAAEAFRARALEARAVFHPSDDFALPPSDASVFYLITEAATLSAGAVPNAELQSGRHPLSALARAAQEVLTRMRAASP